MDEHGRLTPEATSKLIVDAHAQVAVANGRHILWACARAEDAERLQELVSGPLADLRTAGGIVGIEVAHLPVNLLRRQWLERAERGQWTPPLGGLPEPQDEPASASAPPPAPGPAPTPEPEPGPG